VAIKKEAFYEGAALHVLARAGRVTSVEYEAPFFRLNNNTLTHLKYCTKSRSPWSFTFTADEQRLLHSKARDSRIIVALICGADGIAALPYQDYVTVASPRPSAVHIACYRQHGKYYQVRGPDARLVSKISPSNWQRVLDDEVQG
jgi:hypothetical protein